MTDCPTQGDASYDRKRVRPPVGIPMTRLARSEEGGLVLPDGQMGTLVANEDAFAREILGLSAAAPQQAEQPAPQPVAAVVAAAQQQQQQQGGAIVLAAPDAAVKSESGAEPVAGPALQPPAGDAPGGGDASNMQLALPKLAGASSGLLLSTPAISPNLGLLWLSLHALFCLFLAFRGD